MKEEKPTVREASEEEVEAKHRRRSRREDKARSRSRSRRRERKKKRGTESPEVEERKPSVTETSELNAECKPGAPGFHSGVPCSPSRLPPKHGKP